MTSESIVDCNGESLDVGFILGVVEDWTGEDCRWLSILFDWSQDKGFHHVANAMCGIKIRVTMIVIFFI